MTLKRLCFALIPMLVMVGLAEVGVRSLGLSSDAYRSGGSLGWTARPNLMGNDQRLAEMSDREFLPAHAAVRRSKWWG